MTVNGQVAVRSPADGLLERLDDPEIAAALGAILDHADLLALVVTAIDGFLRRSDTIVEAVSDGVHELRGVVGERPEALADVDLQSLVGSLSTLSVGDRERGSHALRSARFGVGERSAHGPDPGNARRGRGRGEGGGGEGTVRPSGVFGGSAGLKDDDVSRGMGLLIQIARALGRRLR